LAAELSEAHRIAHAKLGVPPDDYYPLDGEYFRIGAKGVIGVIGDHVHTYIAPDDRVRGTRDAIRLYQRLLDSGKKVIFPVYYKNWVSVSSIKRLGAELLGVDEDNFLHYELRVLRRCRNSRKPA
jgi:hypothetical protein